MWLVVLVGVCVLLAVAGYWFWYIATLIVPSDYFKDKVVILTGASEGIGAELAVQLSSCGARLVIAARNEAKLRQTEARCHKYTKEVLIVPTDVSEEPQCSNLVEKTVERFGAIDVLILNAAKSDVIPFEKIADPFALVKQTMDINFMQCVYLTKHALPHLLKARTPLIVPVSSVAGLLGSYGSSAYAASKHAIHGFFNSLALEFGNRISILILPLPYVNTATAAQNMKPTEQGYGMSPEECAARMCIAMPNQRRTYLLTWDTWLGVQIGKLAPNMLEGMMMDYYRKHFNILQ
eukprot:TRINITY_DN5922_c0_g1_i1.p1 TRINITY_DN5922_c0_g1~~TRINITY_DN5922_c0_g1_i1.p1  ORF type:complete len:293 (+),score=53.83 TRINITY_DN5922_c0_g1_i1:21-899(+)